MSLEVLCAGWGLKSADIDAILPEEKVKVRWNNSRGGARKMRGFMLM